MSSTSLPAGLRSPTSCRVRASMAAWCRWANEGGWFLSMRSLRLALYIFAGFWFGGLAAFTLFPAARERLLPSINVRSAGQALVGGPFTLIDHTGKRVTDQDFRGKFLLVFFGFTNCPDVCPTALQVMAAALDKLGPNAARITPVLISVDP